MYAKIPLFKDFHPSKKNDGQPEPEGLSNASRESCGHQFPVDLLLSKGY